jgi:two-component system, OmpR family, alkaline phosphatase synthesis response regulator PhoP
MATAPSPAGDLSSANILVVDDNEQNLELLVAHLEELGCELRTAADGVEAMERIREKTPDLVLLDVMMPRMSGFQTCQKIRANPATKETPVLMVTALTETSDVERALDLGADDFLTKPVNRLELITRVRAFLNVSRLRREVARLSEQLKRST